MTEIAGWRANQLGHFVVGLELAAVDLDHLPIAAVQDLGQGLDGAGLAGAGRAEQQEDADRPPLGVQPGLVHLHVRHDALHGRRLADDLAGEQLDKIALALGPRLDGRRIRMVVRSHGIASRTGRQRGIITSAPRRTESMTLGTSATGGMFKRAPDDSARD